MNATNNIENSSQLEEMKNETIFELLGSGKSTGYVRWLVATHPELVDLSMITQPSKNLTERFTKKKEEQRPQTKTALDYYYYAMRRGNILPQKLLIEIAEQYNVPKKVRTLFLSSATKDKNRSIAEENVGQTLKEYEKELEDLYKAWLSGEDWVFDNRTEERNKEYAERVLERKRGDIYGFSHLPKYQDEYWAPFKAYKIYRPIPKE